MLLDRSRRLASADDRRNAHMVRHKRGRPRKTPSADLATAAKESQPTTGELASKGALGIYLSNCAKLMNTSIVAQVLGRGLMVSSGRIQKDDPHARAFQGMTLGQIGEALKGLWDLKDRASYIIDMTFHPTVTHNFEVQWVSVPSISGPFSEIVQALKGQPDLELLKLDETLCFEMTKLGA
ncbi:hypothetical protein PGQ11_007042 [Apiospora arundinis]|uniref:Uncharacterized protein n=1 Tax=Apiospora arundinis TaxID=335852 RepID=A0ABR2IV18_9PEZI